MLTSQSFSVNKLSQKGLAHIFLIIILLLGIISGVYLVQKTKIFKPKASERKILGVQELTDNLIKLKDSYRNFSNQSLDADDRIIQNIVNTARDRREILAQEIITNPLAFIEHATLLQQRDYFPKEAQEFIEQEVDFDSYLSVLHMDDTEGDKIPFYMVNKSGLDGNSDLVFINFIDEPKEKLYSGLPVRVHGISLGSNIVIPPDQNSFQPLSSDVGENKGDYIPSKKGIKAGVIFIRFHNFEKDEKLTPEEVVDSLFGNKASVADYLKQNSFGDFKMIGELVGIFDVDKDLNMGPLENYIPDCEIGSKKALDKYKSRLHDIVSKVIDVYKERNNTDLTDKYDLLFFATGTPTNCTGLAIAFTSRIHPIIRYTPRIFASLPNTSDFSEEFKKRFMLSTYTHEIMHGLGIEGHANYFYCHGKPVERYYSGSCTSEEYADYSDILSTNPFPVFMNALHRLALGFIPDNQVEDITYKNGVYKIYALEENIFGNDTTKVLKIRKKDSEGIIGKSYYYLSFRHNIGYGYFSDLPTNYFRNYQLGVSLHFKPGDDFTHASYYVSPRGRPSMEVDTTFYDGFTFDDTINKFKITQLSHDEKSATIKVEFYDVQ